MKLTTGIDLVHIPAFAQSLKLTNSTFIQNHFHLSELNKKTSQHLAGLFAAKEAIIKALDLKPGSWLDIRINHHKSGKPSATITGHNLKSSSLSISHHGDYAISSFTAIL